MLDGLVTVQQSVRSDLPRLGFFRPSVLLVFFSAEEQSVDVGLVRPETRTQGFSLDFLIFGSFGVKNIAKNKMSTQNN